MTNKTQANKTELKFGYPQTLIKEYQYWRVLLRQEQATLGALVLCARSECTEFSALKTEAFTELAKVTNDIEHALHAAFSYEKINYLMLMMVDPHVHYHVIPRYAITPNACGLSIVDSGWPALPQLAGAKKLDAPDLAKLSAYIQEVWPR